MAPTTPISTTWPTRMRRRRRSSAASATLGKQTSPTIRITSQLSISEKAYKGGREDSLPPLFLLPQGRRHSMKHRVVFALLLAAAGGTSAQVASPAPTGKANQLAPPPNPFQVSDQPVAKVNGAVLTDRDLQREMYTIFPYARQHNGFPKSQEAAIRQGALEMIIFEELVYQEAQRRKLVVPAAKLSTAEGEFRKQFSSPDEYKQYLQSEMQGSEQKV